MYNVNTKDNVACLLFPSQSESKTDWEAPNVTINTLGSTRKSHVGQTQSEGGQIQRDYLQSISA